MNVNEPVMVTKFANLARQLNLFTTILMVVMKLRYS
jgi:hypothetical protein